MRKASTSNSREISDAKLAELKDAARHILADCRSQLLTRFPFCGSVIMNLNIVPTRDTRIATAATDGATIYFDIDFLSRLSPNDRLFVLAHEVWHGVMQHMLRTEARDRKLFNIATDMEVNELLRKDGMTPPLDAVLPEKHYMPSGLSVEEYYHRLVERQEFEKRCNRGNSSNGEGSADGQQDGDSSSDSQPQNQNTPSGNKDGEMKGQFDKHIYEGDNAAAEPESGDVDDKYGKVGHDPDYQPNVTKNNIEKLREAAVSAAQKIERERGELPGHISQLIEKLTEPEIDWRDVLVSFVTRTMGERANWSNPNRRFVSRRMYLPSHEGKKLNVAVGIDTSGSTNRDIPKFLGELNAILGSAESYELTLLECDTRVTKYEKYDETNPLSLENYVKTGGGGTRLAPIFEKLEEENDVPDCAIVFTDGECEQFDEQMNPGYPVLWVLTKDGHEANFKFGEVLKFKEDVEG